MTVKSEIARSIVATGGVVAALIGIIVAAVLIWDRPIALSLRLEAGTPLLDIAELLAILGNPLSYLALGFLALLFWGLVLVNTGFAFVERRLLPQRTAFILLAAAISWSTAIALQMIFGRARPHLYLERGIYAFHPFNLTHDFSSFPSSHAAVSAAMAAVLSMILPGYRPTFFFGATLVAASRIAIGYHYLSDTVAGMLLGIAIVAALERGFDRFGIDVRPARSKWR